MTTTPTTSTLAALAACATALVLGHGSAWAQSSVTKHYDNRNFLTGVDGVVVGGKTYNVQFLTNVNCVQAFSGCDSASDFTFTTVEDSLAASQALVNVLAFADLNMGPRATGAQYVTPYGLTEGLLLPVNASGASIFSGEDSARSGYKLSTSINLTTNEYTTVAFALWTDTSAVAAPVPEPGSWALMATGLGAVGFIARRRRHTA